MSTDTDPGYTMTPLPDVTIAGRTFRAEEQHGPAMSSSEPHVWLYGSRGAVYFLRGFTNRAGLYAVVSWKSGAELRDKYSRAVRVVRLGDVIEDVTAKPRPIH